MIIFYAFYMMFAAGTGVAMATSDKEFNAVSGIVGSLFWPVFWSSMICCNLMDK